MFRFLNIYHIEAITLTLMYFWLELIFLFSLSLSEANSMRTVSEQQSMIGTTEKQGQGRASNHERALLADLHILSQ